MTSLADHWDDSNYLPVGWHDVVVADFKLVDRDPPGVKFVVHDATGKMVETEAFWLRNAPGKEDSASPLWTLTGFAKACGLTREEARGYEPDNPNSHTLLVGRKVRVLVTLEKEKYHRATEWVACQEYDTTKSPSGPLIPPASNPTTPSERQLPAGPGFTPDLLPDPGACPF